MVKKKTARIVGLGKVRLFFRLIATGVGDLELFSYVKYMIVTDSVSGHQ